MKKVITNLNVNDYECVDDLLRELLESLGIMEYSFDDLDKYVEYVTGTINIVKLGDKPNSLKHKKHNGEWSEDIAITDSYRNAVYYRLDALNESCKNNFLHGSWATPNKYIKY